MRQMGIWMLAWFALAAPAAAAELEVDRLEEPGWEGSRVADPELEALRGGLRVRGLEIAFGLRLLDQVDGKLLRHLELGGARRKLSVAGSDPIGEALAAPALASAGDPGPAPELALSGSQGIVLTLINDVDGAAIQRNLDVQIDIRGFRNLFGAVREHGARGIQRSLLRRIHGR